MLLPVTWRLELSGLNWKLFGGRNVWRSFLEDFCLRSGSFRTRWSKGRLRRGYDRHGSGSKWRLLHGIHLFLARDLRAKRGQ